MEILDLIFSTVFYICGVLLIISHIKDTVNGDSNAHPSTLTHGLLFVILAILVK